MNSKETLKAFLEAWKIKDFQKMYSLCQKTWCVNHTQKDLEIILQKNHIRLKGYKSIVIKEHSEVLQDVSVFLKYGGKFNKITVRIIKELEPYRTGEEGEFGINPISILKFLDG